MTKFLYTNEFYVGHTLAHNIRSTYKDHYTETKYKTAAMIRELKINNLKPCCFVLETQFCTAVQAYKYVVVWTKIFIEQGYKNLDAGAVVEYATDLLPENQILYETKKQTNLQQTLSCSQCLFPDYGRKSCPLKKEINQQ